MLRNTTTALFALMLLLPTTAASETRPAPKSMSTEQIKNERNGIHETQKQINLFKKTGETIRDGACRRYWYGAVKAKEDAANMKNPGLWKKKIDALNAENRRLLKEYKLCFSRELPKHKRVYNHYVEPAKSYEEFIAIYRRVSKMYNAQGMPARYHDLGQELKSRGVG